MMFSYSVTFFTQLLLTYKKNNWTGICILEVHLNTTISDKASEAPVQK